MPDAASSGFCRRSGPAQLHDCFPDTIVLQAILSATVIFFSMLYCYVDKLCCFISYSFTGDSQEDEEPG